MKTERYEKELLGLKDRVKLLEELIEKEKGNKNDGYPKEGELFHFIQFCMFDKVPSVITRFWDDNEEICKYYWNFCHGSTSKAKVEWTIKHIELINEIKKYTSPFKYDDKNWFFVKEKRGLDFVFSNDYERGIEWGYFHSTDDIEKAIEQFGEEYILNFLFEPIDGDYKKALDLFVDWGNEETEMPF